MDAIKTYLLNCSFHGLPFVVNRNLHWTERLFWIISVVFAWNFAVYIMLSSYEQFNFNAISFTVDTSYLDWKTNFPVAIVCEKGNSRNRYYAKKWFGDDRDFYIDDVLKDIVFFQGGLERNSYKCTKETKCIFANGNYTMYTNAIRSTCTELFDFCAWNDKEFECCQQMVPINTIYGVCYGINSLNSNFKLKDNLQMFVKHSTNLAIGKLTIDLFNPNVKVFLLSPEGTPLYTDDSNVVMDGISTSSHYKEETNVFFSVEEVVNEEEVKMTSIERRGCQFPYENNLKTSKVYGYSSCIVECMLKLQMQMCKCNHHLMPGIGENAISCDIDGLICLTEDFDAMMKQTVDCDCQTSCAETEINIIGMTTQQNFTDFRHEEATSRINFIFQAPIVKCIRKVVNGYLDLIVSMGGTAGLCVGASLLMAVEVVYYFTLRPLDNILIKNRIRKRRVHGRKKSYQKRPPYPFLN